MLKMRPLLEGRKLRVFDFDDTLAKSDALIYLTKADGTEIELDPGEYAVYKEEPGDEFDFRDFSKMLRNPRAIKQNIDLLKKAMSNPQNKVTVLTARALVFPLRHFFKHQMGIEPYVVGVAGADPRLKSRWIEKHIQKGYDDIFFMDDSKKNLRAVELLRNKYPKVKIVTQLAENVAPDHDGKAAPYGSGYKPAKKKRRTETIRKVDNDWVVYPKKGGKRLGTHKTKKAALKQLAAIEINKAKSEGIQEDSTRTTKKGGKGTLKRKMTRAGYGGKITISKLQKFKNRKGATAHDKAQANMVINFMRANRKK